MKNVLLLSFFIYTLTILSQTNKCDCVVKLIGNNLKLETVFKHNGYEDYFKMKPKGDNKVSYNKMIKDSASFWFILPYVNDTNSKKIVKVKKISSLLCVNISFNNLDSVPIYVEPTKDAKIIKYLHKEKKPLSSGEKSMGYELNDHWFSSCKKDWVKIINIDGNNGNKYSATGWIKKEHYLKQ